MPREYVNYRMQIIEAMAEHGADSKGMTSGELEVILGVHKVAFSSIIKKMEADGEIEFRGEKRRPTNGVGQQRILYLTDKGRRPVKQETPLEHSSLVGGSTASRRINCPGSYKREQKAPKSKGSIHAREGTALHEMIAQVLDQNKEPEDLLPFTHNQPEKHGEPAWTMTIEDALWVAKGEPALDMFDSFLSEIEADQEGSDAVYMIEESGEFPEIPGAFGTSDVVFRCGEIAGIWDWKFGRNKVTAEENEQLMFYFAAMRAKYPSFFEGSERVMLCISQPMADDQEPEIWETDHGRIDAFIEELKNAIRLATHDDAPIEAGPWCKFADCKAVCELHIGAASKLGEAMSKLERHKSEGPGQVDDMGEFLGEAMELAELAEAWASHIATITQERLEGGLPVPGYKVVAKKSSGRVWTADDSTVISRLRSRGLKADDYYKKTVVTPPQAEKLLKKLGKELPDDIVEMKPSSGYTLTKDGDPRPSKGTPGQRAKALGDALMAKAK